VPPMIINQMFTQGFAKGWEKGMAKGCAKGYIKGHEEGWNEGFANGWGTCESEQKKRAWKDEEEEEEEKKKGPSKKNKKGKKGKGSWAKWMDEWIAQDPPDLNKFPRFQVWTDHEWFDFREKTQEELCQGAVVNGEIRHSASVQYDMGGGPEYQYAVSVFPEEEIAGETKEELTVAVDAVSHHKHWTGGANICGWQANHKRKRRPVRVVFQAEERRAGRAHQ